MGADRDKDGGDEGSEQRPGWWPEGERAGEDPKPARREGSEGLQDPKGSGASKPPRGLSSGRKPSSKYTMFVGVAFLVVILIAFLNLINNEDAGILGNRDDRGWPLASFAVPDALGPIDADANIAQDDCEGSANPCPAGDRRTPACEVDPEGAIRICDYFDKPLAISFWFTRGGDCLPSQDAFDAVAQRRDDEVHFLSIDVRDDKERVVEIVQERGWEVPVGWDRDGAVSNLYRVGGCPTIVLARPGGILHDAKIGAVGERQVDAMIDDLLRASRAAEPRSGGQAQGEGGSGA